MTSSPSTVENPQTLACTESFSYGWLVNTQPPHNPTSFREYDENFNFDVPVIPSPAHLAHADEIFSGGQIKAAYKITATSAPSSPLPLTAPNFLAERKRRRYHVFGKLRRSSKKIFHKCIGFVCRSLRKSSRVDDLQRKVLEASPRHSTSVVEYWSNYFKKLDNNFDVVISPNRSSNDNLRCDTENSIREAILYCKRSIEK
ncbi:hypothetical protein ACS0TY_002433 [Phlomoides rotata]